MCYDNRRVDRLESEDENWYEDSKGEFFLWGENGPLYWILIMFLCPVFVGVGMIAGNLGHEARCAEYIGAKYVYDNSHCYRLLDNGQLQYIDIDLDKKITDAQKRSQANE